MLKGQKSYWKEFIAIAFVLIYLSAAFMKLCVVEVATGENYLSLRDKVMNQETEIRNLVQKLNEKYQDPDYKPTKQGPFEIVYIPKDIYEAITTKIKLEHELQVQTIRSEYENTINEMLSAHKEQIEQVSAGHDRVTNGYDRVIDAYKEKLKQQQNSIVISPSLEIVDRTSGKAGEKIWMYTFRLYNNPKPTNDNLAIYDETLPEHLDHLQQITIRTIIVSLNQDANTELGKLLKEEGWTSYINVAVREDIVAAIVRQ